MASNEPVKIDWLDDVAEHDYEAALHYLTLLLDRKRAKALVAKLRDAKLTHRRSNDILRASQHPALPMHDPGVIRDHAKAVQGHKLSPVLVVSFKYGGDIADGYHRVSLAYNLDPFALVPLRLASL